LVEDPDEADMVVTLKSQERRQPHKVRDAAARGVPIHIVRSNTVTQMESFVRAVFGVGDALAGDEAALREVEEAIAEIHRGGRGGDGGRDGQPVELTPRNSYLRRLQHEMASREGLASESKGEEPFRRVVIHPD
ncbi:MAG TPA: R3H domain-containing nucleic acid-binding protein, partial [Thermoanaerobaculia bacterium]